MILKILLKLFFLLLSYSAEAQFVSREASMSAVDSVSEWYVTGTGVQGNRTFVMKVRDTTWMEVNTLAFKFTKLASGFSNSTGALNLLFADNSGVLKKQNINTILQRSDSTLYITPSAASSYATSSALSSYLLSATAASTYQPIGSYLTSEVDGSVSNEIQTISKSVYTVTLSNSGGSFSTADADSSTTNEIELPSQTGNANKRLVTDGSSVSWQGKSFNNAPGRSLVSVAAAANGFQVSSTRDVNVSYSVKISCAVQIGVVTNVEGYVVLEIAATNSATAGDWTEIARMSNGQNIGLALAFSNTVALGGCVAGIVPLGYYTRLRSVNVAGTPTYLYLSGQEVLN